MQFYTIEITDLADAGDYIAYKLEKPMTALNMVKGIQDIYRWKKWKNWKYKSDWNGALNS